MLFALGIDLFEPVPEAKFEAPADVVELAQARWQAKKARDWGKADELRAQIKAKGWEVFDKKDGFDLKKA